MNKILRFIFNVLITALFFSCGNKEPSGPDNLLPYLNLTVVQEVDGAGETALGSYMVPDTLFNTIPAGGMARLDLLFPADTLVVNIVSDFWSGYVFYYLIDSRYSSWVQSNAMPMGAVQYYHTTADVDSIFIGRVYAFLVKPLAVNVTGPVGLVFHTTTYHETLWVDPDLHGYNLDTVLCADISELDFQDDGDFSLWLDNYTSGYTGVIYSLIQDSHDKEPDWGMQHLAPGPGWKYGYINNEFIEPRDSLIVFAFTTDTLRM